MLFINRKYKRQMKTGTPLPLTEPRTARPLKPAPDNQRLYYESIARALTMIEIEKGNYPE